MRFLGFPGGRWIAPLFVCLLCDAAWAETTYSGTRTVPKSHRQEPATSTPEEPATPSGHDDATTGYDNEDDDGEPKIGFSPRLKAGKASSCFEVDLKVESLGGLTVAGIAMPLWFGVCLAGQGLFLSHVGLLSGSGEADAEVWSGGRWRFGAGFGLGAAFLPGLAGGFASQFHLEAVRNLGESANQVRFLAGLSGADLIPRVDFERDVYVDGRLSGLQYDETTGYVEVALPLLAEGLWHPGGGSLYLAAGGGAAWTRESVQLLRSGATGPATPVTLVRGGWTPIASLAIGRFMGGWGGHGLWRFEIRYQASLHVPRRLTSFPADNGLTSQGLAWDWAWLW